MRILAYADTRQEAEEKERYWISRAESANWRLLNKGVKASVALSDYKETSRSQDALSSELSSVS